MDTGDNHLLRAYASLETGTYPNTPRSVRFRDRRARPGRMGLLLRQRCGVAFAQDTQHLLMKQAVRDDDGARRYEVLVSLGGRSTPAGLGHEESPGWQKQDTILPGATPTHDR